MSRDPTRRNDGYALIEFAFAVTIMGLLAGALITSYLRTRPSAISAEAYIAVQEQARRALEDMAKELRGAGQITPQAGPQNNITFRIPVEILGPSPRLFDMAAPCSGICWGAYDQNGTPRQTWRLRYSLIGTQLVRDILNPAFLPPQPGRRVLATNVAQFVVTQIAGGTVTLEIQVSQVELQQLPGGSMSTGPTRLKTRVRLRNT